MTIALEQPTTNTFQRYNATWHDYELQRDRDDCSKIAFNKGWLWVYMGYEGPNHARFSDLLTAIIFIWAFHCPDPVLESFGRCLLEKPNTQACAPDLVLYKGENIPRWNSGAPRRIDLSRDRVPDLVGEISDTTLSLDLDEQKRLYASLGIAEYWVADVKGLRLFAFALTAAGTYEAIAESKVLVGLPISLVEQTLEKLAETTNTVAANWFMQQIQSIPS